VFEASELKLRTFPTATFREATLPTRVFEASELRLSTLPVTATRSARLEMPHTFRVFAPKIIAEFA
jgi:hypothetical protein